MIQESFPILSVAALEPSLRFYRDLLGGTIEYAFPPDGEPQFVTLKLGDSTLGLGATTGGPASGAGAGYSLCAYVADCDAAVAAIREAGYEIREEPNDAPWGERMARAGDPDGYEVLLVARM
jgi:uncharacterized glyoxalase superfamily protein PhnB